MTKEVLVSISGAHSIDGDAGDVEVITAGSYYYKNLTILTKNLCFSVKK